MVFHKLDLLLAMMALQYCDAGQPAFHGTASLAPGRGQALAFLRLSHPWRPLLQHHRPMVQSKPRRLMLGQDDAMSQDDPLSDRIVFRFARHKARQDACDHEVEVETETGRQRFPALLLDSIVSRVVPWLYSAPEREPETHTSLDATARGEAQHVGARTGAAAEIDLSARSLTAQIAEIRDLADLEKHLPGICTRIFAQMPGREKERTYQGCLQLDLESAGVRVDREIDITLMYRGHPVGTRRCDLLLTTADGQRALIEIKAVEAWRFRATAMEQLEFYMHHMGVDHGYLINFPRERKLPDVPESSVFSQERLLGSVVVPMRDQRSRLSATHHTPDELATTRFPPCVVEVVKVVRTVSTSTAPTTQTATLWPESYW